MTRTEGIHLSAAELAIVVGIAKREASMIPVGQTEIAERLGVPLATVGKWRTRHLLPEPSWTVGGRPAWEWGVIEQWATKTGRL